MLVLPSIHPSIHSYPFIHLNNDLSILPFIDPSIHSSIRPPKHYSNICSTSILLSAHLCFNQSNTQLWLLLIHLTTLPFFLHHIPPPIHPSKLPVTSISVLSLSLSYHPSILACILPSINPISINPPIYPHIRPPLYQTVLKYLSPYGHPSMNFDRLFYS